MTSQQHLLARDVINVIMKSPEELLKEMEEKRIRFATIFIILYQFCLMFL